ncbi:DUF1697 domain-containing protein [Micropruina sp.]|uniref:DUF1697 domain-containing protein n=1 Tax=Micropruina sp. TaxID=2737536 RepID=UPI0039E44C92
MTHDQRWAGLLRAVNVGGRTLTMATLKKSANDAGFTEVATLLASGNLTFTAQGSRQSVRERLERAITADAGFNVEVLLRSKSELRRLVETNPFPDSNPSHVIVYFMDGPAPAELEQRLAEVAVDERVRLAGHELWVDFGGGMARSPLATKLPRLARPLLVTGRNVNTVGKLAAKL